MTGMLVSWGFSTGGGGSASWADLTGGFHGVVIGLDGYLRMSSTGDSFSSNWSLLNSSSDRLAWIRLNGAPGRTLFDCGFSSGACDNSGDGAVSGTAGSALGYSHTRTGGFAGSSVLGEYANLVGVDGAPPVGDLFEQLTITFVGSLGAAGSYTFRADTDNSRFDRDIPTSTVPEPSTYALMAAGLAAVGLARRRRVRAQ